MIGYESIVGAADSVGAADIVGGRVSGSAARKVLETDVVNVPASSSIKVPWFE